MNSIGNRDEQLKHLYLLYVEKGRGTLVLGTIVQELTFLKEVNQT